MIKKIQNHISELALSYSIILYVVNLALVRIDTSFYFRWITFSIYMISIALIFVSYLIQTLKKTHYRKLIDEKEALSLIFIVILIEILSFIFLINYPYVSMQDEVRDAGLDAMRIANGTLLNFFTYGNYGGYGNIIPAIAAFFYQIFGSSVLTYRIPSVIVACLDISIFYCLLRLATKRSTALIGAIIYATFPLHMLYARTELVVIFDAFWASVILLGFYLWNLKKRAVDYIFLGTILGIASTYHTASRTMAILILGIVLVLSLLVIVGEKGKNIKKIFLELSLMGIFCLVGFGPMILKTTIQTFTESHSYAYDKNAQIMNYSISSNKVTTFSANYMKSFLVWFSEGTTSRYPPHQPLLPPLLAFFFVIGIVYALFVIKKPFFYGLVFLVLALPFTNSAVTGWINADHRLLPLLPLGAIFAAIGISQTAEHFRNKFIKIGLIGIVFLFLLLQTFQFFTQLPINGDKTLNDYLSMHIIYFLKDNNYFPQQNLYNLPKSSNLCMFVSPLNYKDLNLLHYKEQYEYFLPQTTTDIRSVDIPDNEAYLYKGSCPDIYKKATKNNVTICTGANNFYCPKNYIGDITIHY